LNLNKNKRWPAFVDFLDRVTEIKYPTKKQNADYVVREGEKVRPPVSQHYNYRTAQIDSLTMQPTEQDRLNQINSEIANVKYMKQVKFLFIFSEYKSIKCVTIIYFHIFR
jgi:hypothetical protein